MIGPRQPRQDFTGDWARLREIRDAGCLLVRPDHHVSWRAPARVDNPGSALDWALGALLGRTEMAAASHAAG